MLGQAHAQRVFGVLAALLCCSFGTPTLAQDAKPAVAGTQTANADQAPIDPDRASQKDMADTVRDPRLEAARKLGVGTWKWVVPPVKMKGAYNDHDPIGVAIGKLIPADCSINWTDPDTHRLFCFTSATSMVYFLDAPKANTARADKGWHALKGTS
jgi:hypothetical protein